MRVTEIREFDKKRSEVRTDEALRFVIYRPEIRKYELAEGEEITQETLDEILKELLPKRAKLRAMNLLKARDYTEARLREKLTEGGYPDPVVEEAIDYVKSYHYVDDARYTGDFIRSRMQRASRRKITADLMQRGIDPELIEQTMEELYSDGLLACEDPEISQIRHYMTKKHFDPETATYEDRQKFMASMARKGFSSDSIRSAINSIETE